MRCSLLTKAGKNPNLPLSGHGAIACDYVLALRCTVRGGRGGGAARCHPPGVTRPMGLGAKPREEDRSSPFRRRAHRSRPTPTGAATSQSSGLRGMRWRRSWFGLNGAEGCWGFMKESSRRAAQFLGPNRTIRAPCLPVPGSNEGCFTLVASSQPTRMRSLASSLLRPRPWTVIDPPLPGEPTSITTALLPDAAVLCCTSAKLQP